MASFDPFDIIQIPPTSSQVDIKKAYPKVSVILHADKGTGNEKALMMLNKAYQALTDDGPSRVGKCMEIRDRWEGEFGVGSRSLRTGIYGCTAIRGWHVVVQLCC